MYKLYVALNFKKYAACRKAVNLCLALLALFSSPLAFALDESETDKLTIEPMGRVTYKSEVVNQENFDHNANAQVFDLRLGVRLGFRKFSVLLEGEAVVDTKLGDFNSKTNSKTLWPVVADPESEEINQAWARYENELFALKLGRQKMDLVNGRFIGSARHRLNEQTYDAIRATIKPVDFFALDYVFVDEVHTPLGDDSPKGDITGNTHLLAATFSASNKHKLSGYSYLIESPQVPINSLRIFGTRYEGVKRFGELNTKISVEYAHQTDYKNNPAHVGLDYLALEAKLKLKLFDLKAGYAKLEGDGEAGFQTPYGRKHGFQGLADQFTKTPKNGVIDHYLTFILPLNVKAGSIDLSYHKFKADIHGDAYGAEFDLRGRATIWRSMKIEAAVAYFSGKNSMPDVTKFWLIAKWPF
ncbi:MAG: alginate export family protein [Gammaproteobacteria bacterium]|nr:alginate export family protein [Gammaproteobacteria bacterium]